MTAQPNQSLIHGIECLQALVSHDGPIGCRQLARQLDLSPITANRLLSTLASMGLAQQDEKRRYLAGPGIHVLAAQSMLGSNLLTNALPILPNLGKTHHHTALGVLWKTQVTYLYYGEHGAPATEGIGKFNILPATESSIGRALLAQLNHDELEKRYLAKSPQPFHSHRDLYEDLENIREKGFAAVDVTTPHTHTSLAVAIDSVSALAITNIGKDEDLEPLIAELKLASEQLSS